jgi:hypothetical protein
MRNPTFAAQGLHNSTDRRIWDIVLPSRALRKALLIELKAASWITDRNCQLKPPYAIKPYVDQQGRIWFQKGTQQ